MHPVEVSNDCWVNNTERTNTVALQDHLELLAWEIKRNLGFPQLIIFREVKIAFLHKSIESTMDIREQSFVFVVRDFIGVDCCNLPDIA